MSLLHNLSIYTMHIVKSLGYFGVFLASAIEYACLPAPPSEVVIPLIGVLSYKGEYNIIVAYIFTILGGVGGSLLTYIVGYFGGKNLIEYIGNRFVKSREGFDKLAIWFARYGKFAVLIARIMPFTRAYISLVAGAERLDLRCFIVYSSIGFGIWNGILISIGYFFGGNYKKIFLLIKGHLYVLIGISILLVLILLIIGGLILIKKRSKRV